MLVSGVASPWGSGAGGSWTGTGWVSATSPFLRARVAAAFVAAARRVRVLAALRPAARCFLVPTAFLAAARRLVAAAFFPALFRLGLISPSVTIRDGLNLKLLVYARRGFGEG